jgi:cobalamin 5'-phosphate synthase/cobalamin synthase
MGSVLAAFKFLTILPVPGSHRLGDDAWSKATAWYPLVGFVLGTILAGLGWLAGQLWSPGVAAAIVLVAWVSLTGALHLDGFVDCCDALLAPVSKERRLEILRDVHVGAFGIVGAILLLLTKYVALAALAAEVRLPALVLVPVLARWAMTAAVVLYPYARTGPGLGRRAKSNAGRGQLGMATAIASAAMALAWGLGLGWIALLLWLVTTLVFVLTARWIQGRLGGLTGDAYGAICELLETMSLLALASVTHLGLVP